MQRRRAQRWLRAPGKRGASATAPRKRGQAHFSAHEAMN